MSFENAGNLQNDLAAWKASGEYLKISGHQIFVKDEGDSQLPVLLLIHGFPTSSWDWSGVWDELKTHFRLVALDMLGFGFSDKPNVSSYSIHGQADIVEALIAAKSLDSFHVLAHDYGDTVAQELLARQQSGAGIGRWLSCCFLNGGLFPETHHALLTQKLLLSPLGPLVNKLAGFKRFSANFSSVFGPHTKPTAEELALFWQIINEKDGKHIFHNLITYMRDRKLHRERWVKVLQQSAIPLALINGSLDPVSGAHMVARYQELNCRLDYLGVLAEIGHYPQVEDSTGVVKHYLTFMDGIGYQSK
ncbi:alpha/beta hydrolase [uncultured Zhongshania sp.]|jgi:pimeloyl-ACP methyl ester carboxylesterase|uniref:alpha/beta fold hydrolase n=1 Tax=uncultured Zhongshania sp. TaxID=1642288 RepID=UPI0025F9C426|nr:alpha/beta hydrolase [uncultured Zhongshania sp.]